MRVPYTQENLSGKNLDEQSRENWVPARAQSGHKDEEQPVVLGKQSTGHTVFRSYSAAECQNNVKWLIGVPSSQKSAEQP